MLTSTVRQDQSIDVTPFPFRVLYSCLCKHQFPWEVSVESDSRQIWIGMKIRSKWCKGVMWEIKGWISRRTRCLVIFGCFQLKGDIIQRKSAFIDGKIYRFFLLCHSYHYTGESMQRENLHNTISYNSLSRNYHGKSNLSRKEGRLKEGGKKEREADNQ